MIEPEKNLLRGWKAIESYTQLTRRGLIRNGYPVRRERRSSVYALKSELDAFMRRDQTMASRMAINSHE